VVFDLHGNQISEATDSTGQLVREFIANFPRISWRQKFTDFLSSTEHIDVTLWGFPKNHTNGFRYLRHIELPFSYGTAEFWQFSPEHSKVWSTEIPEKTAEHGMVDFFEDGGQEFVLIAFGGTGAYILSEETGKCIEHFEYRNLDSHGFKSSGQDSRPNLQKNDRNSLSFAPYRFSFDAERGLLACGDANSRMLRIISVERPHKIVFEANLEDNPRQPSGGTWSVSECSFEANGKYLMIGYQYSGRLTDKSYRPVEIFDTSDWHLVMRINDPQITSSILPAISPDAKFLAIIKDGWLEIGGFRENLINLPTASETTIGDKSK
jgi:hypothetical protein